MKKFLLSIFVGIIVMGAAFAVPGPEDRRKLCEQHPDKYVWVEKTQACIPINPCEFGVNEDIAKAYCLDKVFITLPMESDKRDMILERYAEKVLHTEIKETILLGDCPDDGRGVWCSDTLAIKTSAGDYFAASYGHFSVSPDNDSFTGEAKSHARAYAFASYGYSSKYIDDTDDMGGKVNSKQDCQDIADFASLLLGELINHEFKAGTQECILKKY